MKLHQAWKYLIMFILGIILCDIGEYYWSGQLTYAGIGISLLGLIATVHECETALINRHKPKQDNIEKMEVKEKTWQ